MLNGVVAGIRLHLSEHRRSGVSKATFHFTPCMVERSWAIVITSILTEQTWNLITNNFTINIIKFSVLPALWNYSAHCENYLNPITQCTLCILWNYYTNVDAIIKSKTVWEETSAEQSLAPSKVINVAKAYTHVRWRNSRIGNTTLDKNLLRTWNESQL